MVKSTAQTCFILNHIVQYAYSLYFKEYFMYTSCYIGFVVCCNESLMARFPVHLIGQTLQAWQKTLTNI